MSHCSVEITQENHYHYMQAWSWTVAFLNKKPIFVQIICAYCFCLFTANNLRSKDVQKSVKNPYYTSCLNLVLKNKWKVNKFLKNSKIYLEKGTFTLKNGSLEVLHVYLGFEVFHKYLKISGITILLSKRIKTLQLLKRHQHPLTSEV